MQTNHLTGLTDAQVAQSREKNGANILTPPKKDSLFKKFPVSYTHLRAHET